jgi:hypothetical protein
VNWSARIFFFLAAILMCTAAKILPDGFGSISRVYADSGRNSKLISESSKFRQTVFLGIGVHLLIAGESR